jgi:hypothetical protein
MSRKGFVDKNLFGLKDKLRNYPADESVDRTTVPISNSQTKKEQAAKENKSENSKEQLNMKSVSPQDKSGQIDSGILSSQTYRQNKNSGEYEKNKPSSHAFVEGTDKPIVNVVYKKEETAIVDKEYFKALIERKKEFIHKRSDILKRIKKNLEKLPVDIERYEKQLAESKEIKKKLTFLVENINIIKEDEWDKKDFSLDLANAMRKVENSRLELFTLQQKTDYLLEDDIPGLEKNQNSFVPELTSLSARQIFKLGASFFFPLIIGLVLTGILISIAMFIAMGVI